MPHLDAVDGGLEAMKEPMGPGVIRPCRNVMYSLHRWFPHSGVAFPDSSSEVHTSYLYLTHVRRMYSPTRVGGREIVMRKSVPPVRVTSTEVMMTARCACQAAAGLRGMNDLPVFFFPQGKEAGRKEHCFDQPIKTQLGT